VSLAQILAGMHDLLGGETGETGDATDSAAQPGDGCGCGGCGCSPAEEPSQAVRIEPWVAAAG
jgi:hypothetical protein